MCHLEILGVIIRASEARDGSLHPHSPAKRRDAIGTHYPGWAKILSVLVSLTYPRIQMASTDATLDMHKAQAKAIVKKVRMGLDACVATMKAIVYHVHRCSRPRSSIHAPLLA